MAAVPTYPLAKVHHKTQLFVAVGMANGDQFFPHSYSIANTSPASFSRLWMLPAGAALIVALWVYRRGGWPVRRRHRWPWIPASVVLRCQWRQSAWSCCSRWGVITATPSDANALVLAARSC